MGFDKVKVKANLKLMVNRIKISNGKRSAGIDKLRIEMGELLKEKKYEKAKIRAEQFIGEDMYHQGYEVLLQLVDKLQFRMDTFDTKIKTVPEDLAESITSLIWVTKYDDSKELKTVATQFQSLYGKGFVKEVNDKSEQFVNPTVLTCFSFVKADDALLVALLKETAEKYKIEFNEDDVLFI